VLRPFEIHEPSTVGEASRLLATLGDDATVYAGGTELIPVMKDGLASYRHLINIKTIPGLDVITERNGVLSIGALATHRRIEQAPSVRTHAPLLARVTSRVANLRVRQVGTIGGNLCFAEPHSDPAAVLLARGAEVVLARGGAERRVLVEAFFTGILQTARKPDEVLVRIEMASVTAGVGGGYERFATHERPTAGVAAVLTLREDVVVDARVVIGSVGPVPARAPDAEAMLMGERPARGVFERAAHAAARSAEILDDLHGATDYKRHLIAVLAARALLAAAAEAGAQVA
jgi:carbon-monoxide dehydrogenase medium subunit